ncbi:hypothetical protein [Streptomyces goshikiensis]
MPLIRLLSFGPYTAGRFLPDSSVTAPQRRFSIEPTPMSMRGSLRRTGDQ